MKSPRRWLLPFILYAAGLLFLLFHRTSALGSGEPYGELLHAHINLRPFYTIGNYWKVVCRMEWTPTFYHCAINLGGNILLFIPIGWFLPAIWSAMERFLPFLLTCVLAISLVELTQLFTLLGFMDVDDLILNLVGMTVGYGLYRLFAKRGKL